jgi:glycerol-3-phosphate dehydrogenase
MEAQDISYNENGQIASISCKDVYSENAISIKGKVFVNACGPWSDEIRTMDQSMNNKRLHLTKGVHIVFDRSRLPLQHSVYFDVADGRMIFAIPRGGVTYVGTTDTDYTERKENPAVSLKDVNYLLDASNNMFPSAKLKMEDVQSSWAGLRPLIHEEGKSPSELSRKDEVFLSPKGLITITGGKLTGYRIMAQKVVDLACKRLSVDKKCTTDSIQINGYAKESNVISIQLELDKLGLSEVYLAGYLQHTYGSQVGQIIELFKANNCERIIEAEALFCLENEMSLHLMDFYVRRTGRMYFNIESVRNSLEKIGTIFANHYHWDAETLQSEIVAVKNEINNRSVFN